MNPSRPALGGPMVPKAMLFIWKLSRSGLEGKLSVAPRVKRNSRLFWRRDAACWIAAVLSVSPGEKFVALPNRYRQFLVDKPTDLLKTSCFYWKTYGWQE